ncbi:hypothetical protein K1719_039315 [Acacia pycnantha]|nr:hypothetical protein K1719_039315 [Acacia pycnantha]
MARTSYLIEYEGLHSLCTNCGIYGHKAEECKAGKGKDETGEEERTWGVNTEASIVWVQVDEARVSNVDVWKVVRKPNRIKRGGKEKEKEAYRNTGSRFGVLATEEVEDGDYTGGAKLAVNFSLVSRVVLGEPRCRKNTKHSREKREGDQKRQDTSKASYKGINDEKTSHLEQRKDNRGRDKLQKLEKPGRGEKSSLEREYIVEVEKVSSLANENQEVGPKELELTKVSDFSSFLNDTGESGRFGGLVGKFWAGPSEEGMDCEVVEETQLECIGPVAQS